MDHPSRAPAGKCNAVIREPESEQTKIDIDTWTEPELIELNHKIVERLKFLASMRAHADMMAYNMGEQVSFSPVGRSEVTGILVKYNKKTVTILTEDGQKWNVSPHLLARVKKPKRKMKRSGNVIAMPPKK